MATFPKTVQVRGDLVSSLSCHLLFSDWQTGSSATTMTRLQHQTLGQVEGSSANLLSGLPAGFGEITVPESHNLGGRPDYLSFYRPHCLTVSFQKEC